MCGKGKSIEAGHVAWGMERKASRCQLVMLLVCGAVVGVGCCHWDLAGLRRQGVGRTLLLVWCQQHASFAPPQRQPLPLVACCPTHRCHIRAVVAVTPKYTHLRRLNAQLVLDGPARRRHRLGKAAGHLQAEATLGAARLAQAAAAGAGAIATDVARHVAVQDLLAQGVGRAPATHHRVAADCKQGTGEGGEG